MQKRKYRLKRYIKPTIKVKKLNINFFSRRQQTYSEDELYSLWIGSWWCC